jgi:hypothetical protein
VWRERIRKLPERLEASQRNKEGRSVPTNEVDAFEVISDARDGTRNDSLLRPK